jgi:RNA polymerase sigma-70 factor (family 1)
MDASPDTIRQWLAAMAHSDDSRAFRAFFDYFYPDAYRMAFSYVREQETAEELTSDVFLKLWARRRTLTEVAHIRSYLLVAIKNHCLNHHRQKARPLLPLDDVPDMAAPDDANPEQATVWNDMYYQLAQIVETLPPRCRLIFRMVREQQRSYRDVADELGIAPKTVEIQMGIALKRLSHLAHTLGEHALLQGVLLFSYFF